MSFQPRDCLHQTLVESIHGLRTLAVATLIRAPRQIATNANLRVRQFLAVFSLENESAVNSAPTCPEPNYEPFSCATGGKFIEHDMGADRGRVGRLEIRVSQSVPERILQEHRCEIGLDLFRIRYDSRVHLNGFDISRNPEPTTGSYRRISTSRLDRGGPDSGTDWTSDGFP